MQPFNSQSEATSARSQDWIGARGQPEPNPYMAMTVAERIKLVWPLTVAAWAFRGNPWDESRLRRDVERIVRRER